MCEGDVAGKGDFWNVAFAGFHRHRHKYKILLLLKFKVLGTSRSVDIWADSESGGDQGFQNISISLYNYLYLFYYGLRGCF